MSRKIVFLFEGQGSQYLGMGKSLYEKNAVFKEWMDCLDQFVINRTNESIIKSLYIHPNKMAIHRTLFTHSAIFMVQYSAAQMILSKGIIPTHVLGISLGEFTAAAISGVLKFDEAIDMVLEQATIIEKLCPPTGGMMAILQSPTFYEHSTILKQHVDLVLPVDSSHFVVAGSDKQLDIISKCMENEGISCYRLLLRHAFHSKWIDAAADPYKRYLEQRTYCSPRTIFLSGLFGRALTNVTQNYFWDVVRNPICSLSTLLDLELGSDRVLYFDIGPSRMMTNIIKRMNYRQSNSEIQSVLSVVT
ncbi:acyltransferase domain-containing protein [Paenibacillus sp. FSL P2-0136]|uniref:acyltransferase domain-containing protein n=1 Tax=Paenibacillus sp. FSL P2-0136 TaxID=2975317 RepID=UPI0030DC22E0